MSDWRHLLITGLPGVGKTTLIRDLARRLTAYHPAGFYTEEIRVKGVRQGFRLVALDGREQVLSRVEHRGPHRVGRYGVDVPAFERLLAELDLCHSPARVVVIDEIGKMECCSERFVRDITLLLDSPKTVIATIALKGEGCIRAIKQRPDCRVITVTAQNRDQLVEPLTQDILGRIRSAE